MGGQAAIRSLVVPIGRPGSMRHLDLFYQSKDTIEHPISIQGIGLVHTFCGPTQN